MTRPRGRSLKGTRLIARTPHGHWKTTTFLAGLRTSGLDLVWPIIHSQPFVNPARRKPVTK